MKNYIIYGLGISGISIAKYLCKQRLNVVATDDNPQKIHDISTLHPQITFQEPSAIKFDQNSVISFSPGIPLNNFSTNFLEQTPLPEPQKDTPKELPKQSQKAHKIIKICQETGAKLSCDMEIFYNLNKDNNFIGITGTNGKSTTTAIIGHIFKELNIPSAIGGNIGIPCFDLPQNHKNFNYIFETSSYQLDLISNLRFNIACLLNITYDHIERHGSFENYILSKKRIFLNQTCDDYAIIDIDNPNSRKIFQELAGDKNFKAQILKISTQQTFENQSTKHSNENFISIVDNLIRINFHGQQFKFTINPILKGEHNSQNIAFALAVACCHLSKEARLNNENIHQIIKIIEGFTGLKHRLQLIKKINNIAFINDSKATNAESTANALKAYDNIFWILGGRPKENGINILKPYFSKIKKAYLIGEASADFAKVFDKESVIYTQAFTLQKAFSEAYFDAQNCNLKEVNIILSPACASFDQWQNFEERGDYFCNLVNEI